MKKSRQLNRRGFLTGLSRGILVVIAVVVVEQILRFLSFQPARDDGRIVPVGNPTDYALGRLTYVPEARAYVGHDAGGLYAVDAVCTHLGCLVELNQDGTFECPCHGSQFDAEGQTQSGPATKSLRHLRLWLGQDGQLTVDRTQVVESASRLIL